MTYIAPCHDCPLKQGCEQRDEFRRRAKGMGAASIKFRCPRLAAELRPGRRVELASVIVGITPGYYPDDGDHAVRRDVPATITGALGNKFTCVIDPGHISENPDDHRARDVSALRFRRSQRYARIRRFLDEPDMPVCKNRRVMRNGGCDRHKDEPCYCKQPMEFG